MTRRTLSLNMTPAQGQSIDEIVTPACQNCRFWDGDLCRKRPPFIDWQAELGFGRWPKTMPESWCGDFKRLPIK